MRTMELWKLNDFFQRFTPGYAAHDMWVREKEALGALAEERSRIRRELEEAKTFIAEGPGEGLVSEVGDDGGDWVVTWAAIDRIIPEEKES